MEQRMYLQVNVYNVNGCIIKTYDNVYKLIYNVIDDYAPFVQLLDINNEEIDNINLLKYELEVYYFN